MLGGCDFDTSGSSLGSSRRMQFYGHTKTFIETTEQKAESNPESLLRISCGFYLNGFRAYWIFTPDIIPIRIELDALYIQSVKFQPLFYSLKNVHFKNWSVKDLKNAFANSFLFSNSIELLSVVAELGLDWPLLVYSIGICFYYFC